MQKNRLTNLVPVAFGIATGFIIAGLISLISLPGASAQDATPPEEDTAQPAAFVFRDSDGSERVVTNVVHSTQYQAMIEEQKAMKELLAEIGGKVDYLVTQHAVDEFENPDVEPVKVYLNTATYEQLQTIPGIGAVKAGSIIATRGTPEVTGYNPFTSWQDLAVRVNGIGMGTVGDMQAAGVLLDPPAETE